MSSVVVARESIPYTAARRHRITHAHRILCRIAHAAAATATAAASAAAAIPRGRLERLTGRPDEWQMQAHNRFQTHSFSQPIFNVSLLLCHEFH